MKLYTVFTESHRELFENYFLKTLPWDNRLELRVLFKPQVCNAEFHSEGWRETMYYKVRCFKQALYETEKGECFMFSDPDIQFFKPFYDDLLNRVKNCDAVFQNDYAGGVNTGFFVMRSTAQTRAFVNTVEGNLEKFPEEQACFNYLLQTFNNPANKSIAYNAQLLPPEYWTYGEIAIQRPKGGQPFSHWNDEEDFDIPKNIVMHHANWTKTFKDKIKILDRVREKFKKL